MRQSRFLIRHLARCGLTGMLAMAAATAAQAADERFDITRFQVEGNTLLPAAEVDRLVGPLAGPQRGFADIQLAIEALQQAYRAPATPRCWCRCPSRSWPAAREAAGAGGVIGFGHRQRQRTLRRRQHPRQPGALQPGRVPTCAPFRNRCSWPTTSPAKQVGVTLADGAAPGTIDAKVLSPTTTRCASSPRWTTPARRQRPLAHRHRAAACQPVRPRPRGHAGLHHLAGQPLGHAAGVCIRWATASRCTPGRQHRLGLRQVERQLARPARPRWAACWASPARATSTACAGTTSWAAAAKARPSWCWASTTSASTRAATSAASHGEHRAAHAAHLLLRALQDDAAEPHLQQPARGVDQISLATAWACRATLPSGERYTNLDGRTDRYSYLTPGNRDTRDGFVVLRAARLPGSRPWPAAGRPGWPGSAQYTDTPAGGQRAVRPGRATAVRGFQERAVAADSGVVANAELYTPELAGRVGLPGQLRGAGFLRRGPRQPTTTVGSSGVPGTRHVSSMGVGARYVWPRFQPAAGPGPRQHAGTSLTEKRGDWRAHLSAIAGVLTFPKNTRSITMHHAFEAAFQPPSPLAAGQRPVARPAPQAWAQGAGRRAAHGLERHVGQRVDHQNGSTLNINQTTPQALVNFATFNVGSNALVDIRQPSSASALLARTTAATRRRSTGRSGPTARCGSSTRPASWWGGRAHRRGQLHREHAERERQRLSWRAASPSRRTGTRGRGAQRGHHQRGQRRQHLPGGAKRRQHRHAERAPRRGAAGGRAERAAGGHRHARAFRWPSPARRAR
jgi:hypothetical protein